MGEVKALLPLDGVPAVLRVAGSYAAVGVEPVVVLGGHADRIAAVLTDGRVRHVVNRDFAAGMYSSVRRGVQALPDDTSAFFVHPVDCALVRPETLGLIARSADFGAAVTYPVHGGARGHPPLVAARLRDTIAASDPDGGLQALLRSHGPAAADVAVGDPHILFDMDDRAAYERLCRLAERERLPDPEACRALEERHGTPAPVAAHAETVAVVAGRLGAALRAVGVCLDLRLLEAAALLHDLARAERRHAEVAADVLVREGYPRVAAIVHRHMDLPVVPAVPGEAELLYLADKLTVGAEITDLARKRARAEARFSGDAEALAAARDRLDKAAVVAGQVEELAGRSLWGIVVADTAAGDADSVAGRG